ncbi:hypothetical protein G7Z17_g71 [Cylindrodendrum hubeiense]|uniref:Zn(2)-C6 fungal-type domain-containing protein n=1 Tax=Cylindrodendrum hubeiense TaxID=595255 RepID=A0A9P5HP05_9HYPO|nr:hypothetical protein G7Z17_g71 [Cylindrodendrum hubeiense]
MEGSSEPKGRNTPSASARASATRSKYAWRACQECRRRRAKCDGTRPACSRCLGRDINCVYATEGDNRGTAPKSYVHLLQARINVLEQVLRLHNIDADESVGQLMAMDVLPVTGASAAIGASSAAFDQLCTDFEGALCFDESSNFDRDGEARYFGTTSGRLEFQSPQSVESEDSSSLAQNSQRLNLYSQTLNAEIHVSEELMNHLIDLYFRWEQPWLQVVDEGLFRLSKQTNGRYFSPLLLNCIMAVGSRYCDEPEVRSDPDDPNTAGRIFLETAEVLLHFDLKWPSITTIQSLSLLAVQYVDSQGMVSLPPPPDPTTELDPQLGTSSFGSANVMHLHRALTTHCQILEKILRNLPRQKAAANLTNPPQVDPVLEELSQKASILCTEAAKEICLIGEMYRENFGSFRQSPLTATHCTLSAALVLLRGYKPDNENVIGPEMDFVNSCIQTLKELSVSWTPPRRYWRSLVGIIEHRQGQASGSTTIVGGARVIEQGQSETTSAYATNTLGGPNDTSQGSTQEPAQFMTGTDMPQDELMFDFDMPFWSGLAPNFESLPEDYMNFDTQDFWS